MGTKALYFISIALTFQSYHCYYSSRRCYGTGDCLLFTKNQDGGFDDGKHQWLVECNDGEGAVAIRDDDTHFEGLSGMWCAFLFPLKQSTRGAYPYYPSCTVRNLTHGDYHCRSSDDGTNSSNLFVAGIYKEPDTRQTFVPSLMKCCETPTGYQIDYGRCYYKKTFDRFGEHYTGEWLVKCDTHHVVTGIGKDINPWDNKGHFTWIQCCPFFYTEPQQLPQLPFTSASFPTAPTLGLDPTYYDNLLEAGLKGIGEGASARVDIPTNYMPLRYRSSSVVTPTLSQRSTGYDPTTMFLRTIGLEGKYPAMAASREDTGPFNDYSYTRPQETNPFQALTDLTTYTHPMQNQNYTREFPVPVETQPTGPSTMSLIQQAANVAAYNQFITTFNKMMASYSKQPQSQPENNPTQYPFPQPEQKPTTHPERPDIFDDVAPNTPNSEQGLPLSIATAQRLKSTYVPSPLPSGLQNYILLASKNPGLTLSQLYTDPPKPYNKIEPSEQKPWYEQYPSGTSSFFSSGNQGYRHSTGHGPTAQVSRPPATDDEAFLEPYFRWISKQTHATPYEQKAAPQYLNTIQQALRPTESTEPAATPQPPAPTTPTPTSTGTKFNTNKMNSTTGN